MSPADNNAISQRMEDLSASLADQDFRSAFMAQHLRSFLADQIHALRGDRSQKAFGEVIGKPQSVVSRLESEDYGKVSLQTLLDIASALDVALLVRYVDFPTFMRTTTDFSQEAIAPAAFAPAAFRRSIYESQSQDEPTGALKAFLTASCNNADPARYGSADSSARMPAISPNAVPAANANAGSLQNFPGQVAMGWHDYPGKSGAAA